MFSIEVLLTPSVMYGWGLLFLWGKGDTIGTDGDIYYYNATF